MEALAPVWRMRIWIALVHTFVLLASCQDEDSDRVSGALCFAFDGVACSGVFTSNASSSVDVNEYMPVHDLETWRKPASARLEREKAIVCYFHPPSTTVNDTITAVPREALSCTIFLSTTEKQLNLGPSYSISNGPDMASVAVSPINADAALVCFSSLTECACHTIYKGGVNGSLIEGARITLSATATRNLAAATLLPDSTFASVCFEDVSHPERPSVAFMRCATLAIGSDLTLALVSPAVPLFPPPRPGLDVANLDPGISSSSAATVAKYTIAMAPLRNGVVLLCYALFADCDGCTGHVCEIITLEAGEVVPRHGRPHVARAAIGIPSLSLAALGDIRASVCVVSSTGVRHVLTCDLLKVLGESLSVRATLAISDGLGIVGQLHMSSLFATSALLCFQPQGGQGACAEIQYYRDQSTFEERLEIVQEADFNLVGAHSLEVLPLDARSTRKDVAVVRRESFGVQRDEGNGFELTQGHYIVIWIALGVAGLAALRCTFRSTWLAAYYVGCKPPDPPEIDDVAQAVVVTVHSALSPRLQSFSPRGCRSPRSVIRASTNRLGDISPRLASRLSRGLGDGSPRSPRLERDRGFRTSAALKDVAGRLGLSPRFPTKARSTARSHDRGVGAIPASPREHAQPKEKTEEHLPEQASVDHGESSENTQASDVGEESDNDEESEESEGSEEESGSEKETESSQDAATSSESDGLQPHAATTPSAWKIAQPSSPLS